MKVSLEVLIPSQSQGKSIPIPRSPFLIGRDPKCHLRPSSALVSNRHCAIEIRDGKVFITDLKSTNGTFLNKERLEGPPRELRTEDRLHIGPLAFVVRIERGVPVDQPTPIPPTKTAGPGDDESIAAVLLSMNDDANAGAGSAVDSAGIPTGGTEVLQTQAVAGPANRDAKGENPEPLEAGKKDAHEEKAGKAKAASQSTSAVAEQLLKKYLRRPRSGGA